jgi:lantibiotic biosynthesis protein
LSTEGRSRWYRNVDAALIRATALTGVIVPRLWPGLDDDADVEQWCAWLTQVWAQAPVAEAVTMASPALAARVGSVCEGQRPRAGRVRRMVISLARYLVWMSGRATPFGLFAGVAPLRFGPEVSALWIDSQHARTRADAVWLAGVVARLESCPALLRRLPVMVHDLVFVRGERLVVPWQPHAGDPDRCALVEASVRHSPAVHTVVRAAGSPILAGDLLDKLAVEFPDAPVSAADGMLAELVARGVLITSLRPPSTSSDGLAHVLDRLQEVDADALKEIAPLVQELHVIHAQVQATASSTGRVDGQARRAAGDRMRALSGTARPPLMVDLRLGCTVVLPLQVADEAESAAGALLRLTPNPTGNPAWRDYHTRFLDRYGGALVPVEQLHRDVLRQAASLADPVQDRVALQTLSGGPQIAAAWQARRHTVDHLRGLSRRAGRPRAADLGVGVAAAPAPRTRPRNQPRLRPAVPPTGPRRSRSQTPVLAWRRPEGVLRTPGRRDQTRRGRYGHLVRLSPEPGRLDAGTA